MRKAVIMAGGAGVRLWPLSRRSRPKQILRLFEGKSLLRQSYERVSAVLPSDAIFVITNHTHLPFVAEELPELPTENLIGEPVGRDTAAAVALSAAVLHERDPDAVIGVFTADHIITPIDRFAAAVEKAYATAEDNPESLVTFGIKPNRPDTQYGYIRKGDCVADGVYEVKKFTEKPRLGSAMKYVASGEYFWNSGMFAWKAPAILAQLEKHLRPTHDAAREIAAAWDTDQRAATLKRLYPSLMRISIDFAVMERAERVLAVEMDCTWVDVGSWPALESVVEADTDGNVSACENVVHLGSRGNIVVAETDHLIATIGVDDLVIVHAPDATLICKKRDAQGIKELVDNINQRYGDRYK
ncbi:MAG: mannose-1-phosphate guanylyltransferase [Planctomycetes bacterium]|nr:mannose-1-phosphate guanylyltransferase [Planctomycetota bacterium]